MISDCGKGGGSPYEILYDDNEEEEETDVNIDRITIIAPATTKLFTLDKSKEEDVLSLQRSLYLNLSKSCLKLNMFGWGIRWASLAVAVSMWQYSQVQQQQQERDEKEGNGGGKQQQQQKYNQSLDMKDTSPQSQSPQTRVLDAKKKVTDALFVRGSAFKQAGRPIRAKKDGLLLIEYGDEGRGRPLVKDCDAVLKRTKDSNKKLAKEVAKWVKRSMEINESLQQQGKQQRGGHCSDGDDKREVGGGGLDSMEEDDDDVVDYGNDDFPMESEEVGGYDMKMEDKWEAKAKARGEEKSYAHGAGGGDGRNDESEEKCLIC